MSLLTVRHLTVYRYGEPVELGEHRMMFRPRESHDLRLVKTKLDIHPRPVGVRWLHDAFDNSVAVASFEGLTSELRFDSVVALEHVETRLPEYPLEHYATTYPFQYSDDELPDLARALCRHYPDDGVNEWARRFLDPSGRTSTMDLLCAMTHRIRAGFKYKRRGEKGVQTPGETLASLCGSCRDFAVLMMEAARSLGLAARFVSGYIFMPGATANQAANANDEAAKDEDLKGGGSTHAWMQVYLPGAGWVDFDPTNSIVGNRNLIRVAVAWDPKHVLPLWGTYCGPPEAFKGMDVSVTVTENARFE